MPQIGDIPADIAAELADDEEVEVVVRGVHGQRMYGTDRRVFVYKKGFLAGALFGRKVASWDYRNISGINFDRGAFYGVVAIHAPGISPIPVKYQSSNKAEDAFSVRHAIPVAKIWDELDAAIVALRGLISEAQHPPTPKARPWGR